MKAAASSRLARIGAVLAVLGGAGVLFAFSPAEARFFWRCPFHLLTGLLCPGCGGQRAAHLLLHSDVVGALRHNALLVLSLPLLLYVFGVWLMGRHGLPAVRERPVLYGSLGGIVMAFFALRNLDAFAWLAPPG